MSKKSATKAPAKKQEFKVVSSTTKVTKPSVARTINGMPDSLVLYSRSIEHPNGDKYTNEDKPSFGTVKKVTQFAYDAAFKKLVDWQAKVTTVKQYEVETDSAGNQKRVAVTLRWLSADLTDTQDDIVSDLATDYALQTVLYESLAVADRMKRICNNAGLDLKPEQVDSLIKMQNNSLLASQTIMQDKANGVRRSSKKAATVISFATE